MGCRYYIELTKPSSLDKTGLLSEKQCDALIPVGVGKNQPQLPVFSIPLLRAGCNRIYTATSMKEIFLNSETARYCITAFIDIFQDRLAERICCPGD